MKNSFANPKKVIVRFPPPHSGGQKIFIDWNVKNPDAQCLVAPCGTKVGKTFGSSIWLLAEALSNPGFYCCWIAPSYLKCKIAFRYMKRMLPWFDWIDFKDGKLEINFANGSMIKFMHGRDAETVVEGEAVDRFVIDEAGKIDEQVWFSLFTTITQTRGKGIVTGTPRGHTWFYDIFKKAQDGDGFFVWVQLETESNPFNSKEAIENAKRLLPRHLWEQYFKAVFTRYGTVFGDLAMMWDESSEKIQGNVKFWVHPDDNMRSGYIIHGVDVAKKNDYTVFYSINSKGKLVGFCRFRHIKYPAQVIRLKTYITSFFKNCDNEVGYDTTGVGEAFGDILSESGIEASITPVLFTNKSKNEMITRTIVAIESGWHKAPRIRSIERELVAYEVIATKSGLFKYSAPEGENDDIVSAMIIAVSMACESGLAGATEEMIEQIIMGKGLTEQDIMAAYEDMERLEKESIEFFNNSGFEDDYEFNEETA